MKPLYPVFLKLEGRDVVLVGGGAVASAKLRELTAAGARVTVVTPDARSEMTCVPGVVFVLRSFVASDLDRAWLVISAATPEINRQVVAAAEERRIFVNAVDDAESASAYTGGVLRKGGVTVAVSTEGRAPALAGLLREGLEAVIPDEVEAWVALAGELRKRQRLARVPMAERRPLLLRSLNRLYEGRSAEVEAKA